MHGDEWDNEATEFTGLRTEAVTDVVVTGLDVDRFSPAAGCVVIVAVVVGRAASVRLSGTVATILLLPHT